MRLLYLSCHAILEYDELKIFEELGINYFSLGSYIRPQEPVDPIRPPLSRIPDPDVLAMAPLREKLTREFVDRFDIVVIMHGDVPEANWVEANWDVMKGKRVILRTIGQNTSRTEEKMKPFRDKGLEIVRYSPKEANIPGFIGQDAVIRFSKDTDEFGPYNGFNREIVTFAQNMVARGEYCHFDAFKQVVEGLPAHVYGPKNEEAGELNGGFMSYEDMRQKMRDSRVYVATGTQPASYTLNFIESWMTGVPVLALGSDFGNSLKLAGDLYEIPELVENGVTGYVSNDLFELNKIAKQLLDDRDLCHQIGNAGRQRAIELFGKEVIKSQWAEFLRM